MRKLEDIPKKSIFKVPEGYFDQLPITVQARMVSGSRRSPVKTAMSFSLKYALPVAALIVAGIFWFRPEPSLENQLEDIDTEQIALYLESTDRVDLEEVHETIDWTSSEIDDLEDAVYSNMDYPNEDLLEELDLENL